MKAIFCLQQHQFKPQNLLKLQMTNWQTCLHFIAIGIKDLTEATLGHSLDAWSSVQQTLRQPCDILDVESQPEASWQKKETDLLYDETSLTSTPWLQIISRFHCKWLLDGSRTKSLSYKNYPHAPFSFLILYIYNYLYNTTPQLQSPDNYFYNMHQ